MLLIIGDSYSCRLKEHLDRSWGLVCVGKRGARLSDESFRRWALANAIASRPSSVLLIVGGNDLARPAFQQGEFIACYEELSLGLLAAGAELVWLLAIPPRVNMRRGDVSAACFSRRRHIANAKLCSKFKRPPVQFLPIRTSHGFLGPDGVHPSRRGWQTLRGAVRRLL